MQFDTMLEIDSERTTHLYHIRYIFNAYVATGKEEDRSVSGTSTHRELNAR